MVFMMDMVYRKGHRRFEIKKRFSSEAMSEAEWGRVGDLLARMIAEVYAEEHAELFQGVNTKEEDKETQGNEVKEP